MINRKPMTTANGKTRKCMNYYTVNEPTAKKLGNISENIIVEARDKASAANKIRKEFKVEVKASNLRLAKSWSEVFERSWFADQTRPPKYSRIIASV